LTDVVQLLIKLSDRNNNSSHDIARPGKFQLNLVLALFIALWTRYGLHKTRK